MIGLFILQEAMFQKIFNLSYSSAMWWSAIGTIFLGIAAVLQERIRQAWIGNPELRATVSLSPPDCHFINIHATMNGRPMYTFPSYYFRIKVWNDGRYRAETVQVFAEKLEKKTDKGWVRVEKFLPMNFLWSHVRQPYMDTIPPKMYRHCDFAHIIIPGARRSDFLEREPSPRDVDDYPDTIMSFDLEVKPNNYGHLIYPGTYRLSVLIAASNAKPKRQIIEYSHMKWFNDENEMLEKGITLTIK